MNRRSFLLLAKIAEHTGRFDDMADMMKGVVNLDGHLNKEERAMLSTVYRHLVGERRVAWRMVCSGYSNGDSIMGACGGDEDAHHVHDMFDVMRSRIEDEIMDYCDDIQDLLSKIILNETCTEGLVSLLKMKGDYYRYAAEILTHEDLELNLQLAHENYMKSYNLAVNSLSASNDTRLGVALNFSVFFYEVAKDTEKAIFMAKQTYQAGLSSVDDGEIPSREAVLVLKLLRDNIKLWNNLLEMHALRLERQQEKMDIQTHRKELAQVTENIQFIEHKSPDSPADRYNSVGINFLESISSSNKDFLTNGDFPISKGRHFVDDMAITTQSPSLSPTGHGYLEASPPDSDDVLSPNFPQLSSADRHRISMFSSPKSMRRSRGEQQQQQQQQQQSHRRQHSFLEENDID